ncbi:hypothetical protein CC80DRAFT_537513 [Byssothecium circinans]|uniref:Extracellular membrane protein CFEM domain-containing protein n=1 Tax=Byssothecium circinans TaxID=147558 RepID=A0A6A5TNJ7_9PLEO|nr:hypothetical protein CC80DRAFT_537513 [Byssothecium circinans]
MPSFFTLGVIAAQLCTIAVAASAASKYDWVSDLPNCWEDCLSKTDDGCHSQKCLCTASQEGSYLQSAVECARDKCEGKALEISAALLAPAALYCVGVGNKIPDEIMATALACAAGVAPSSASLKPTSTSLKKGTETPFKTTATTTVTQTSTDNDGHTLQIVQPVVMGPSTISTGDAITSTIKASSSSSSSSSSASASPSQTAQATSAAPTQPQSVPSSSATVAPTQRVSNSGGSPFDNMQAASASHWRFSGSAVALSFIASLFMRL